MSYFENLEERYNDLKWHYNSLQAKNRELLDELQKANIKLGEASHRIEYELEPRLNEEKKRYDTFILAGDDCMR